MDNDNDRQKQLLWHDSEKKRKTTQAGSETLSTSIKEEGPPRA